MELLGSVAAKEKKALNQEVAEKIIETAGSSARMALVLLGQVIDVEGTKEQLAAIQLPETEKQVKELCQLITKGGSFKECAAILKKLKEDPEAVRRQLLGYLNAVLLNNYSPRVFKAIDCLRQDTFHSGMAGLTASIYEIYLK
jgi:DNA polymerase III gamma/tau subunit